MDPKILVVLGAGGFMCLLFVIIGIIAWVNSGDDGDDDSDGDNSGDNSGGDNSGGDNSGGDNSGGDNSGGDNSGGDNSGGDSTPSGTMYHGEELTPEYRLRKDGVTYCPLDMQGHERSEEEDWEDCQKRCVDTRGCLYFNFYPNGGCHLSTGEDGTECSDAIDNPTQIVGRAFVPNYYSRLTPLDELAAPGTSYEPWLTGTDRSKSNWDDCQYRCADTPGCVYFNSYPNGGCHLSGSDATARIDSNNPTNKAGRALKPSAA